MTGITLLFPLSLSLVHSAGEVVVYLSCLCNVASVNIFYSILKMSESVAIKRKQVKIAVRHGFISIKKREESLAR
jgi:hypothetical protein